MKQKNRQLFVRRFISLLTALCMTLCMIITPTTVFADTPSESSLESSSDTPTDTPEDTSEDTPVDTPEDTPEDTSEDTPVAALTYMLEETLANSDNFRFTCQGDAGAVGNISYALNGSEEFISVGVSDGSYDSITLDDSINPITSITIKIQANDGYQLDTGRGVMLRVNGGLEYSGTGDEISDFSMGHTFDLSTLLGESTASESSFELEFGFVGETTTDGNFRFTCQGDPSGGTVSYQTNSTTGFETLNFGEGNSASISLSDSDTSITIKIEPDTENGFLLDTDRGVILRVGGAEMFTADGDAVSDFTSGYTFNLSSYIEEGGISENTFELEFEIKNQNGGGSGYRPYEGEYSGTTVENVPLTVSGNVDFCINDSELFNITSENTMNLTCDYTYDGSGYVDFYVQWRLDNRYTSIVINGTDYYSQLPTPDTPEGRQALLEACKGQLNEFKLKVPYSDSYTVSGAVKTLDESDNDYWQIGNFLWFYKETSGADDDDLILNGKMELVGITFNGQPFEQTEYFKWNNDENGGEAVLPAGAKITVKIIPEYGYQLTSFTLNGFGFETGDEQSVFTFEVQRGNFHLGASITPVEDKVESGSDAVTNGNIQLGNGEIDTGSVVLSVGNAGDENKSGFESKLASDNDLNGYTIDSILDINLNQVLNKGNTTDFWKTPMTDLSSPAEISLDLAGNYNNVVVLHKKHDGSFEKLPTTFENGQITFSTNEFSDFALAVEEMNTGSGCFSVIYDNREDANSEVKVKIGDGQEFSANPNAWDKYYNYGDGSKTIKFTVTVPEDRKGNTPLVDVEVKDDQETNTSVIVTQSGDNYTFSITPNDLFDEVSEPSIIVFVNWTEFDRLYPDDNQFMIHTNIICDEMRNKNGTISILGAMTAVDIASLGSEKKYIYEKNTGDLHVIFTPDSGKILFGFWVNGTKYGFEDGLDLPEPQSDGSYDFTLPVDGNEPEILIEAVFGDIGDIIEQVAKPVISPNGGTFTGSQTVTITCTTAGATIYYTTDGSVPTTSSTKYTTAFAISTTTTVKAIAVKEEMNDSTVVTATFTKQSSTPTDPSSPSNPSDPTTPSAPSNPSNPTTPSAPADSGNTQNSAEPEIKGENGKAGWDAIADELLAADDGDKIVIDMNGTTEIPKNILEAIMGEDVDIVLEMGNGITWTINGKDVKDPQKINLSISNDTQIPARVINKVTGENSYVTISLKHDGDFGFEAVLSIDLGKENKNLYANLYYYNTKTKKTEFVGADKINNKGKADFSFTHASDYIIVIDKVSHAKPVTKATSTANSARLSWNEIPGATKYAVYKYKNGKAVKLIETKKLSVKITKLKSDTEYQYIVRAYVDGKWTTMKKSDIVTVKTKAK